MQCHRKDAFPWGQTSRGNRVLHGGSGDERSALIEAIGGGSMRVIVPHGIAVLGNGFKIIAYRGVSFRTWHTPLRYAPGKSRLLASFLMLSNRPWS